MPEIAKTEHLKLNQWEPEDQVLRTDFNADNQKIDAAFAAVPLVKLKEVVTQQDAQQVDVDVSDIDFDAYDEVIVYVELENATANSSPNPYCFVQVNGDDGTSNNRYACSNDDRMSSSVDVNTQYMAYIAIASDENRYRCRAAKLCLQKRGQFLFCQSEFGYHQINSQQFYSRTEAGMFRLMEDISVLSLRFTVGLPESCELKAKGKIRFLGVRK